MLAVGSVGSVEWEWEMGNGKGSRTFRGPIGCVTNSIIKGIALSPLNKRRAVLGGGFFFCKSKQEASGQADDKQTSTS